MSDPNFPHPFGDIKTQELKNLNIYDVQVLCDHVIGTFSWHEKFVELFYRDKYPDWLYTRPMKNHPRQITRPDIGTLNKEKAKMALGNCLSFILISVQELEIPEEDKPQWLQDNLQPQFYKWFDQCGFEYTNDFPLDLAELLYSIDKALKGERYIKFLEERGKEASDKINNMSDEQFTKVASKSIASYNNNFILEQKKAESLKHKSSTNQTVIEKFSFLTGDARKGKQKLDVIVNNYEKYLECQMLL